MSIRQRLEKVEKAAPVCQTCKGTGTRPAGSQGSDEAAMAWWTELPDAERRTHIARTYRLEMMSEDDMRELISRIGRQHESRGG